MDINSCAIEREQSIGTGRSVPKPRIRKRGRVRIATARWVFVGSRIFLDAHDFVSH
jgi:hypothetical protein